MLAKCANPSCVAPFRYFSEGRIFYFHTPEVSRVSEFGARQIEHYWLCGSCARSLTVVGFQGGVGIQSRDPRQADHPRSVILLRAPQSA